MKCLISLIFTFALAMAMAMSMSAQAEPGRQAEAKSCNVAHRAAIAVCHLARDEEDLRGDGLSLCKTVAGDAKASCMDGGSGHAGDPDGSAGDDGSNSGDDGSNSGDDGSGSGTPPGPSACETDCQSSYDSTALSCESTFACEGALCEFLELAKQGCLDSASATLNSCMAGCGG